MQEVRNVEDLKNSVDAIIRAEEHKTQISDQIAATYGDLKSKGYDIAAVKKVVSDIRKDMKKVKELEVVVNVYRDALNLN